MTNWQKGQEFSCLPSNGWHKPKAVLKSTDIFIAHWVKLRFCNNLYRDYCTGACLCHLWQVKPFQCHYDSRVKITSKNKQIRANMHPWPSNHIFAWYIYVSWYRTYDLSVMRIELHHCAIYFSFGHSTYNIGSKHWVHPHSRRRYPQGYILVLGRPFAC